MPVSSRPLLCAIGPLLLTGCIPQRAERDAAAIAVPTPPPDLGADATTVRLAEPEPVWTAQQVVANARTVPASNYVVRAGDTLRGVGNRTGAGSEIIAKANGLSPPYALRVRQTLRIPGGRYHLVAEGETGIAIAAAYAVPWRRIVEANGLEEPYVLRRGQRLLLPDAPTGDARSLEQRAAAFRIDIDDVLTGGQPAARDNAPVVAASTKPRPLPSNAPIAQPSGFAGSFAWPLHGTILSRFGPGQSGSKNNGIDIAAPVGTPIRASADGVVAYAGDKVAVFGGLVLINHGSGWVSAYGHASRVDVVRGQKVSKGQVIGLTGDTGYASKPKLHFELRKDRAPVDPLGKLPPA
ncbi:MULTISPECIES: M23 family metallopeptidase [Sphingobium]|jgi:murein DD-endopeptidase MepM/ murein hydrolase activator NlpD|uniref:M23 family metallopeptidase n=1 Tax=Sphingobium TaxID=165695 RepID=UPI001D189680|nr:MULTISPECIES: M23 family metallopeptidase [Sphingobium]MCC4255074.1 M23 family metallopeptidase [Sphingobium lactosutens]MEC9017992.1 M23 family metallopeptidase [Pseudomonadota bacterium]MEE2740279.1 M23 family metallopeptidase [Pseudomonadota bacterium]|tara:strand:- start:5491 stop:6546 length:1056 start_codon:yes stop_codon:yes gene_type:complete